MNIILIKFVSNSGLKLLDSQLEILSKTYPLPIDFLKRMKRNGITKIWIDLDTSEGDLVAYESSGQIVIKAEYKGRVVESDLVKIKPVKNPKRVGKDEPEVELHIDVELDKIVCFRLSYDEGSLIKIAKVYGINPDYFISLKKNGCHMIWVQLGREEFVCTLEHSTNVEDIRFNKAYLPLTSRQRKAILSKDPIKPLRGKKKLNVTQKSETTVTEKVEYNIDDILDKISLLGMSSLTKSEKDFLDSFSKN